MQKNNLLNKKEVFEKNIILIGKIFESFEVLEETLGQLKLEEPLFITYAAKKAFTNNIYNSIKNNEKYKNKIKN